MVIKLEFFDKEKNTSTWWDRLIDRVNNVKDRQWVVNGGGKLGERECSFQILKQDGTEITDQKNINEITWCFFIEQININHFYLNGTDVTKMLSNR